LAVRAEAGNLRKLSTNRAAVDLYSNDYLGIATSGILNEAIKHTENIQTGSTGSRLLSGNSDAFDALERKIAAFHDAEAALIFNSGYDANTGLLQAIAGRHTIIVYDELCHASIIDGIRLSLCAYKYAFAHNDADALAGLLERHAGKYSIIVVVESVYSMDGDIAPLAAIAGLCSQFDASLVVDEAHATGVFGTRGEGLVQMLGLQRQVFARVHTFGKALGCHGAVVAGSALLRDCLINFARSFIYTTALPPHSVAMIDAAYDHLASPAFSNQPLHELIGYFRSRTASQTGWVDSTSAIQAFVAGGNERCRQLAATLQQTGLQVNAILSPTVATGGERLRVCLHTFNTRQQVDQLLNTINL